MKYLIIIAALCCFIGIVDLPIGYYTFLRIIVSFMALIIIVNEFRSRRFWFIAFVLIFIFFNPFIPIYFYLKPYWIVLDIIVGLLLFIYFLKLIPKTKIKQPDIIDIEHEEIPRTRDRIIK
ncbi:hypothetical protein CEY12_13945 [Chryseobacterium sp. T16E-39]|uniref:DUF6804 family protein n=1 Tax=Chryseobacterium sp. T16E-39 TaxID=2015076 RepID=UPI000B5B2F9A|nr:DUF6804 family protein [Chryseobacterium sp. T16E-39]ASK31141.1 hypothetical protein CEY12_13945 [Chryseobacterium sp. T16E-39]